MKDSQLLEPVSRYDEIYPFTLVSRDDLDIPWERDISLCRIDPYEILDKKG
jgi:hypothetical protein